MSRRFVALLPVLAVACGGGAGGTGPEWDPGATCDAFATASCLDAQRVLDDVATLAAPALTGRRAGTPGNDAAVALVADRFEALGLRPTAGASSLRHPFPLPVWTASRAPTLRLGTARYVVGVGEGLDVVEFSGAGAVARAPVAFVGHGLIVPPYDAAAYPGCPADPTRGYDDFAGVDVAGKVVIILRGYPADDVAWFDACPAFVTSTMRARNAAARGAAAVVFAPRFGAAWTGATADNYRLSPTAALAIPVVQATRAALEAAVPDAAARQAAIDASASPASSVVPGLDADVEVAAIVEERQPANVIGVLTGTDPALRDQVVLIGAHLDHMGAVPFRDRYYPGADDNASGTAVLLELARAAARAPTPPKRTIVFAAWNGEELGLLGSSAYKNAPSYPLADTVAAFSIDMVGDGSPGMTVYGGTEFPGIPATLASGAAKLSLPDWPVFSVDPNYASDHAPFARAGVPAVLFLTPQFEEHDTYHTPADVSAGVHRDTLDAAAKLVWATVREYALGTDVWVSSPIPVTSTALRRPDLPRGPVCEGPRPGWVDPDFQ